MNYNPQDPKNFAFYQTYLDNDDGAHSPRLRPGSLIAVIAILMLGAIIVALTR